MATVSSLSSSGLTSPKGKAHSCTYCGSNEIYRQRPRGIIERHVYRAFHFSPYWCVGCDRRFYLRVHPRP